MPDDLDRPVEIWIDGFNKWVPLGFDYLQPNDIVRFDNDDNLIYRVMSYPFLSSKYSSDGRQVGTIINTENLYYWENYS